MQNEAENPTKQAKQKEQKKQKPKTNKTATKTPKNLHSDIEQYSTVAKDNDFEL